MDSVWIALRVLVSLAVVLGLVWLLAQAARRRGAGRSADAESFAVLGRQALGRGAGVAVVRVGDQALVLGVTEHSVRLLTQTPLTDVLSAAPAERREPVAAPVLHGAPALAASSALAGSALSPATWSRAVDVLRERSTRR